MRWVVLLALLPLAAGAQPAFGPLRLDDSLSTTVTFPAIDLMDSGSARCIWGSLDSSRAYAYGQMLCADGAPSGSRIVYRDMPRGQLTCAPHLTIVTLPSGEEARLTDYS
jgi:hypothetical protein